MKHNTSRLTCNNVPTALIVIVLCVVGLYVVDGINQVGEQTADYNMLLSKCQCYDPERMKVASKYPMLKDCSIMRKWLKQNYAAQFVSVMWAESLAQRVAQSIWKRIEPLGMAFWYLVYIFAAFIVLGVVQTLMSRFAGWMTYSVISSMPFSSAPQKQEPAYENHRSLRALRDVKEEEREFKPEPRHRFTVKKEPGLSDGIPEFHTAGAQEWAQRAGDDE